jgi:hypothetical protein
MASPAPRPHPGSQDSPTLPQNYWGRVERRSRWCSCSCVRDSRPQGRDAGSGRTQAVSCPPAGGGSARLATVVSLPTAREARPVAQRRGTPRRRSCRRRKPCRTPYPSQLPYPSPPAQIEPTPRSRVDPDPKPDPPPDAAHDMLLTALALAAVLQQPTPQQEGAASPIARVEVTPANPTVTAQDTLRLRARALDAAGRPVPNASFRFVAAGGRFEGAVEADGLVRSGSTGVLPVTVVATVPGARPVLERVEVRMVPGPPHRRRGPLPRGRARRERPGHRGAHPVVELLARARHDRRGRRFVGYERGTYTVIANLGDRSAQAVVNLVPRDVRRPAEVVGRLPRTRFTTEEVWLHPNGARLPRHRRRRRPHVRHRHQRPGQPVRDRLAGGEHAPRQRPDDHAGRTLPGHTREGASDRRNGIVIASLEDPAHPKVIAEFTEGVTAGVHSAFVYRRRVRHARLPDQQRHGRAAHHRHQRPVQPARGGRWRRPRPTPAARSTTWTCRTAWPTSATGTTAWSSSTSATACAAAARPTRSSSAQYKYDLNDLYRQVEASGGPGFIRGTHTAWRHRDYVFIADEVFPGSP